MNAIFLASNLSKSKLNEHILQELEEQKDLLRLGQKKYDKASESIKSIQ